MAIINGTIFDDDLLGTPGPDLIRGFGGNDTLDGGFGFDTLDGGAGFDLVTYEFFNGGVNVNLSRGIASFRAPNRNRDFDFH